MAYLQIGSIYLNLDIDLAFENLEKSLELSKAFSVTQDLTAMSNIGYILTQKGEYEKAIEVLNKGMSMSEKAGYKIGSAMLQVRLGRCYFEMNNIDKALYYGLESEKIADMESSFQFEKERKQHESEKLQRDLEIKNQRVITAGLSVGSLFLLLFVLALYQLYVHKKRTNLVLLHQKAKIEELNEEYIVINEQLALSNQQLTEAKEKIEKSEERLRLIIKNSNDIILLIGQDTKIKFISDVATSLTGYSTEEIRSSIVSLVHPEDLDSLSAFWRTLNVKELSIASVQFRLKHKNEDYRWFEAVAQNFVDNPALGAILSNIRDIDVQKKVGDYF